MEFQAKDSFGRKFKGKGELHVSTIRMVFIKDSASADFSAFDMPMANISNEKFNQPIFGANNMTGTSEPLPGGLTDEIKWTLTFKEGGVGTFLPLFFRLVHEMRRRMAQESQPQYEHNFTAPPVAQQVVQQIIGAAYVDPNDPTKLYVSQPVAQPNIPVATAVPMQ